LTDTAFVTGGAGFIGSHVADAFLKAGYRVVVIDDLSTGNSANVPADALFVEADIVDSAAISRLFEEHAPAVVAHLAAQSSVTVSVSRPEYDLSVNVRGTFNILESATQVGAKTVLASTGGALYGNHAPIPTAEEAVAPEPLSPYGASKLAGEAYVATWGRLHGIANVVLRLGNVYGPRQSPHGEAGVVAIFSDRILRGVPPVVYGDGRQTRDYIHVRDVAAAFLTAAGAQTQGTFNVGTGKETDVITLLHVLTEAAGVRIEPQFEPLRKGELIRSCLDSSRLRSIGWSPTVALEHGLAETYRNYAG
jgi:UDP-glucose 4-epimerase